MFRFLGPRYYVYVYVLLFNCDFAYIIPFPSRYGGVEELKTKRFDSRVQLSSPRSKTKQFALAVACSLKDSSSWRPGMADGKCYDNLFVYVYLVKVKEIGAAKFFFLTGVVWHAP